MILIINVVIKKITIQLREIEIRQLKQVNNSVFRVNFRGIHEY